MSGQKDTLMIMDPVHGTIQLQGREICRIIDTEEFQRLRKIKQLGISTINSRQSDASF